MKIYDDEVFISKGTKEYYIKRIPTLVEAINEWTDKDRSIRDEILKEIIKSFILYGCPVPRKAKHKKLKEIFNPNSD